jgi:hypothetical protein
MDRVGRLISLQFPSHRVRRSQCLAPKQQRLPTFPTTPRMHLTVPWSLADSNKEAVR